MDAHATDRTLGIRIGRRGSLASLALVTALQVAAGAGGALAQDGGSGFPVTVTDDEGSEVVIDSLPQRIISLSPANTEIVYALGAGERLVGGTEYDDYPPEATDLADVATFTGVIMEQVVALDPDLVLAGGSSFTHPEDIVRMRELGYPVLVTYPADTDGILRDIELIGESIGAADQAAALTADMADRLADIEAAVARAGTIPRTFYQVSSEPEIYGPADGSFLAGMVALAGGDPITTGDPVVWSIPLERLIAADPEVIVIGDAVWGVCPADVAMRPGWGDMSAVRDGRLHALGFADVTRPGPRLPDAIAAIAMAIHPDIELEGFGVHPDPCAAG